MTWPSRAVKLTPSTARTAPKRLCRSRRDHSGAAPVFAAGIGTGRGQEERRPHLLVDAAGVEVRRVPRSMNA